jgi:hypothetical protein
MASEDSTLNRRQRVLALLARCVPGVGTRGSDLAAFEERLEALQDTDAIPVLICLNNGSDVPPATGGHAVDGGAKAPSPAMNPVTYQAESGLSC